MNRKKAEMLISRQKELKPEEVNEIISLRPRVEKNRSQRYQAKDIYLPG